MAGTLTKKHNAVLTDAVVWGRLTLRTDQFFRKGSNEPVCDAKTMAPLVMAGLFKAKTKASVEITLEGRKVEREAAAKE